MASSRARMTVACCARHVSHSLRAASASARGLVPRLNDGGVLGAPPLAFAACGLGRCGSLIPCLNDGGMLRTPPLAFSAGRRDVCHVSFGVSERRVPLLHSRSVLGAQDFAVVVPRRVRFVPRLVQGGVKVRAVSGVLRFRVLQRPDALVGRAQSGLTLRCRLHRALEGEELLKRRELLGEPGDRGLRFGVLVRPSEQLVEVTQGWLPGARRGQSVMTERPVDPCLQSLGDRGAIHIHDVGEEGQKAIQRLIPIREPRIVHDGAGLGAQVAPAFRVVDRPAILTRRQRQAVAIVERTRHLGRTTHAEHEARVQVQGPEDRRPEGQEARRSRVLEAEGMPGRIRARTKSSSSRWMARTSGCAHQPIEAENREFRTSNRDRGPQNTVVEIYDFPALPVPCFVPRLALISSAISRPRRLSTCAHNEVPLRCMPSTTTIGVRAVCWAIAGYGGGSLRVTSWRSDLSGLMGCQHNIMDP